MPTPTVVASGTATLDNVTPLVLGSGLGILADDRIFIFTHNDFYQLDDLNEPSSANVAEWFSNTGISSNPGNDNAVLGKLWWGDFTSGGAQSITVGTVPADGLYITYIVVRPPADTTLSTVAAATGLANNSATSGANHVAPGVTTVTEDARLVSSVIGGSNGVTNYTAPPGMTELAEGDYSPSTVSIADEVLTASGATGTRTWTSSASRRYAALTFAVEAIAAETNEGSVSTDLELEVAATGGRESTGTVATDLELATAVTGARASTGTVATDLELAVAATGARASTGAAAATVELAVAATGARASTGAAAATVELATAVSGSSGGGTGTVAASLELAVAATGARDSSGTTSPEVELAVAATGARESTSPTATGLELAVAASGSAGGASGTVAASLELAVAATGARASTGAAATDLTLDTSVSGPAADATGTVAASIFFTVTVAGSGDSPGRPVTPFPWTPRDGEGYPWTPRAGTGYPWTPRAVKSFTEVSP